MEDILSIKNRLLSFFPDTYDKSEGTVLWDICQSFAMEFEGKYQSIEQGKKNFFLKNIYDEEIFDLKLGDYGDERKEAVYSEGLITIKGNKGTVIDKGTLVASDLAEYETLNTVSIPISGEVDIPIRCKTPGKIGNVTKGVINKFPITISGLTECFNKDNIDNGVDKEEIDEARKRVEEKLKEPRTSGNKYDYKYWAKEVTGVGNARVIPKWNGVNSVKVLITDRNNDIATESLISETFNYIEEKRPTGVNLTVESAKLKLIDINITGLKIDINANQTVAQIKLNIKENLSTYINSISLNDTLVSYAQCNRTVLDSEGVGDFTNLKLNEITGTVELQQDEIARFNTLTIDGVVI